MPELNDIARAQTLIDEQGILLVPEWKTKKNFVDKNDNNFPDDLEERLSTNKKILHDYAVASSPSKSFWTRLRAFLGASSKAGRRAKAIKDFGLIFLPFGKKVRTATEFVSARFIKPEQKSKPMMETTAQKIKRFLKQPSTRAGLAFLVMVLGGIWSGINIDADILTQSAIGIVTAAAALWTAVENAINIFRDDDKAAEKRKAKL